MSLKWLPPPMADGRSTYPPANWLEIRDVLGTPYPPYVRTSDQGLGWNWSAHPKARSGAHDNRLGLAATSRLQPHLSVTA